MPGLSTEPAAGDELSNVPLRKAGAALLGCSASILALATVRAWGRRLPRVPILLACWIGCAFFAAGVGIVVLRTLGFANGFEAVPLTWTSLAINVFVVSMAAACLLTTVEYQRETCDRSLGSPPVVKRTTLRLSPRAVAWTGRVIVAWSAVFGALHLYWAVGFRTGLPLVLASKDERDAEVIANLKFVALGLWGVAAASLNGGLIGLSLLRPRRERVPRKVLLVPSLVATVALGVRAVVGLVRNPLSRSGAWGRPAGVDRDWLVLDAVLFPPWFLVGATAFALERRSLWRRAG